MSAALVLSGMALCGVSGLPGLFVGRQRGSGERIFAAMMILGAALGVLGAFRALALPAEGDLRRAWPVPAGAFDLRIDAISVMFLVQVLVIGALGAVYGLGYWRQIDHPQNGRKLRLFYGLLVAAMALLVIARNGILFLFGWEVMALAAFIVVTTEDHEPAVREVGYVYLVATHTGTLCLFAFFGLLHTATGSVDFAPSALPPTGPQASALFLLALAGCGLKAGMMPLHVWLPGAHANAPSHVSALMSGVLIKMGIYGLVRVCTLFPDPPAWWGGLVLGLGVVSGVLGVAFAIGQHDLKRLLAYHSVENIGIILMGLGVALLGRALGNPPLVLLGLSGALLHVWNHGLFKALLFLSAGQVVHATHTREIDRMGGLLRSMPLTGGAFLIGAVAICGLPPLNGFVSELLVYLGLLRATTQHADGTWIFAALSVAALALVGALALACFVKVFGAVFLGQPRDAAPPLGPHEAPWVMLVPMGALALLCLAIGLGSPVLAPLLGATARTFAPELGPAIATTGATDLAPLSVVSWASLAVFGLVGLGALFVLARTRGAPAAGTWDCGYAGGSPRVQYTSSSFAQTLVGLFSWALRPHGHAPRLRGVFAPGSHFASHVPEVVLDGVLLPICRLAGRSFERLRFLQQGRVQIYVLHVVLTLLVLMLWR